VIGSTVRRRQSRRFDLDQTIRANGRDTDAVSIERRGVMLRRLRVEPISSYLERRRKGPIYPVIVANGLVYLSGLPHFDPETGDVKRPPFGQQAEIVLDQMKLCLEAAGSSLLITPMSPLRSSPRRRPGPRSRCNMGAGDRNCRQWPLQSLLKIDVTWVPPSGGMT
jgi:hypothetical protein